MTARARSLQRATIVAFACVVLLVVGAGPAVAAAPTVTSFSPASGPPGPIVSVVGTGFTGGIGVTSVAFNNVGTTFNVSDDQHLSATVPLGATTGKIAVTTLEGTGVSASDFVVPTSGPAISGFVPTSGPPGTQVAITGSHFTGVSAVAFHGTAATFTFVSDGQVNATVPAGATTGKITLTTGSGTATSSGTFTVSSSSVPTIGGFSPTSGPVGTSVTIDGTNFSGATGVRFNGVGATFVVQNAQRVVATVPVGATTGKISLTTGAGTATSSSNFTVTQTGAPSITGFSPRSGPVGTLVTIEGDRFTGVTAVRFNGVSAAFSFVNDERVTATVPIGATKGKLSVTTPAGTDTTSSNFDVTGGGPVIDRFSPTNGDPGTSVTINGDRFTGATSVRFNGLAAGFNVVSDERVIATVPQGATTGRITVTTPAATATSGSDFVVSGGSGQGHDRNVSLSISRRHASGHVSVDDGYQACASNVPVVIKRHRHGEWVWVTTTATDEGGDYRALIGRSRGEYRAKAKRITLVNGAVCLGERSGTAHRHGRR
jgi:hypothetical protein